ncbi:hypothetical protein SDC9_47627 [bioreactor metagenome]|uniref:Uncharacterized protein n=1 Tax=bioreactor metagenome TaxID=1076179 RepID=A0A644WCX7_9ZZZZ
MFYNCFFLCQCHRTLGEIGGHNHRQHLGSKPHGNRKGEQKRFQPVPFCKTVNEQHDRSHTHHEADEQVADRIDTLIEVGLDGLAGDGLCHGAETGVIPRRQNQANGGAAYNVAAHKGQIGKLQGVFAVLSRADGEFFKWRALAGQGRLADKQVFAGEDPNVGRYHIARRQKDNISGDDLSERDFYFSFHAPGDGRRCVDHGLEFVGGMVGAGFLNKTQNTADHYHNANDDNGGRVFLSGLCNDHIRKERNHREHEKYKGKGVDKRADQPLVNRLRLLVGNNIVPVLVSEFLGRLFAVAVQIGFVFFKQFFHSHSARREQSFRNRRDGTGDCRNVVFLHGLDLRFLVYAFPHGSTCG